MTNIYLFIIIFLAFSCDGTDSNINKFSDIKEETLEGLNVTLEPISGVVVIIDYNKDGVMISEKRFLNDIECGAWRSYFSTGEIQSEFIYTISNEFDLGKKLRKVEFGGGIDGLERYYNPRNGKKRIWDRNGELIKTEYYENDILVKQEIRSSE